MNILFWCEPHHEAHHPLDTKSWFDCFKQLKTNIKNKMPDANCLIVAGDNLLHTKEINSQPDVIFTNIESLANGENNRAHLDAPYRTPSDTSLLAPIKDITKNFTPDVVFLLQSPEWLQQLWPNAAFINCELGWIGSSQYPKVYNLDLYGYGKGRALAETWPEIRSQEITEEEKQFIHKFKQNAKKLTQSTKAKDYIENLRNTHNKKITLLPLAEEKAINRETRNFQPLIKILNHLTKNEHVIITFHPSEKAISDKQARFIEIAFKGNVTVHKPEQGESTSELLPFVDYVAGNFSSVVNQCFIFDNPVIDISELIENADNSFLNRSPLTRIMATEDIQKRDCALLWLLTKYSIPADELMKPNFIVDFIELISNNKKNECYSRTITKPNKWLSLLEQNNKIDSKTYELWRELTETRAAEIEGLATRSTQNWTTRPHITIFAHASQHELPLLADTLDSIGPQPYPFWRVVVLSDTSCPDPIFDGRQLAWIQVADIADAAALAETENTFLEADPDGWHARLIAGCRLDNLWLLTLADYLNAEPNRSAFYFDHDSVSLDGTRSDPWFKPDFDIDYLYEMDYIGPTIAFSNAAILGVGGIKQAGAWGHIDTLLRLVETRGAQAIGHISKPMLSLPDTYQIPPEVDQRARSAINSAHFIRSGVTALCKPGFIDGTLRIEHIHSSHPKVSVIIPNRDKVEYLEPCIESIFSQTEWPDFEVMIVDNQSEEPETLEYYRSLQVRFGQAVRVIEYDSPFNFSAQCNLGASKANGEYLLFLNNDTQIIQPQWLSRMMAHAQRKESGAVGCRLAFPETAKTQHAGVSFNFTGGLYSSVSHPFMGRAHDDAGYMNRAWVTQQFSAVTAACLLTSKQVFETVGGFDEQSFAVLFNDVDYCLRLREHGLRVLYTPYAMVCHHENVSLNSFERADMAKRLRNLERSEQEHSSLHKRWLPQLAHDPAMNRHLSAHADGTLALEDAAPLLWDTTFHDCLRVLGVGAATSSVGRYRLAQPLAMLEEQGHVATMMSARFPSLVQLARLEPDTLLMHSAVTDGHLEAMAAYRHFLPKVRLVGGLDDLLTALPKENSLYRNWQRHMRDIKSRLRKSLALCDRLIVSTEPLQELCAPLIGDIRVVPNRLRRCEWDGHTSLRGQGNKPRVGWVGGAQHAGDLALITEVIRSLQHEVEWVFMGMWPAGIEDVRMERHTGVPYDQYPATMAALNLDIALAPLADNDFNRCKSNLRLLEYGAMAWPVIASDVYPFRTNDAPVTRVGTDPQEWIASIRSLVQDPARAAREGQELRAWVDRHYWLDDHFQDWQQALLG